MKSRVKGFILTIFIATIFIGIAYIVAVLLPNLFEKFYLFVFTLLLSFFFNQLISFIQTVYSEKVSLTLKIKDSGYDTINKSDNSVVYSFLVKNTHKRIKAEKISIQMTVTTPIKGRELILNSQMYFRIG